MAYSPSLSIARQEAVIGDVDFASQISAAICSDNELSDLIANRLTDVLFILAITKWLDQAAKPDGVIRALSDKRIDRVLLAIHQDPARSWTVEEMAEIAGQSRSGFAGTFSEILQIGPAEYLQKHRLDLASDLLTHTTLRIDEIADRVGYADTSAFSRAFSRRTGQAPSDFRRNALR